MLLSHEPSCQVECQTFPRPFRDLSETSPSPPLALVPGASKANGHAYFTEVLRDARRLQEAVGGKQLAVQGRDQLLAFSLFGCLCRGYEPAQAACVAEGLQDLCLAALSHADPLPRRWALVCLALLARGHRPAALAVLRAPPPPAPGVSQVAAQLPDESHAVHSQR